MEYVEKSKEKFQFLACFISYYNYIKNNQEIEIPILFDATCSGIQHLSALTKDSKIARLVNILSSNEPSDFYQYCIDQINIILQNLPDNDLFKEKFLKLDMSRILYCTKSLTTTSYFYLEFIIG